jgi:hypothetical protein
VLAHDVELLRRKDFAPFRVGMVDGILFGVGCGAHNARPIFSMVEWHKNKS